MATIATTTTTLAILHRLLDTCTQYAHGYRLTCARSFSLSLSLFLSMGAFECNHKCGYFAPIRNGKKANRLNHTLDRQNFGNKA